MNFNTVGIFFFWCFFYLLRGTKCAVALQVAGVSTVKSAVYTTFINYLLIIGSSGNEIKLNYVNIN